MAPGVDHFTSLTQKKAQFIIITDSRLQMIIRERQMDLRLQYTDCNNESDS